jgi:hypothetical protein
MKYIFLILVFLIFLEMFLNIFERKKIPHENKKILTT